MAKDLINGHSLVRVLLNHTFKQLFKAVANAKPRLFQKLKFCFVDLIGVTHNVFLHEFVLGNWKRQRA